MQLAPLPLQHPSRERARLVVPEREALAEEAELPGQQSPWRVIWLVGGLIWLGVTCTTLWWLLPWAGTTMDGDYVASTPAHAVQHVLVFLVAAVAYRIAVGLGWPQAPWARVRVVLVNTLLALGIVLWSDVAVALVAGFIDGHVSDMHAMLREAPGLTTPISNWAAPLRFFLPSYVLGLCAIALVLVADRQNREALRAAGLARAYAEARMAMLSAQLQPHFLFNSLHAVMGLIDESPRQASTMLARLGDFLRHALETSRQPWVDVSTELTGLGAYLAVQESRFSGGLSIAIDISPQALGVYVPSLLLQPLAENAIEHGRRNGEQALQVRVAVSVLDERLCIAIHNSSPRLSTDLTPMQFGHGLNNVSLRLRAAYGDDARLTVGPDPQGGTTAILDLPARRSAGAALQVPRT